MRRWISLFPSASTEIVPGLTHVLGASMSYAFSLMWSCGVHEVYGGQGSWSWPLRRNDWPMRRFLQFWDGWFGHSTMHFLGSTQGKATWARIWKGMPYERQGSHWLDKSFASNAQSWEAIGRSTRNCGSSRIIPIGMVRMYVTYALQKVSVHRGLFCSGIWKPQRLLTSRSCSLWLNAFLNAGFEAWLNYVARLQCYEMIILGGCNTFCNNVSF